MSYIRPADHRTWPTELLLHTDYRINATWTPRYKNDQLYQLLPTGAVIIHGQTSSKPCPTLNTVVVCLTILGAIRGSGNDHPKKPFPTAPRLLPRSLSPTGYQGKKRNKESTKHPIVEEKRKKDKQTTTTTQQSGINLGRTAHNGNTHIVVSGYRCGDIIKEWKSSSDKLCQSSIGYH